MWNNVLFNELSKRKVVNAIHKIMHEQQLTWPFMNEIRKKQVLEIISKHAKTKITKMVYLENEKAFVINYIKDETPNKLSSLKLNCKNENSDFNLTEIYNAVSWEEYHSKHLQTFATNETENNVTNNNTLVNK